jgi:hypothetical protein
MNLSAPSTIVFWIAVVITVLAVLSTFVAIPVISGYSFWVAILGFIVLAGGVLMKGT